jgi:digeranylgeranylglycerophospholipid reductase
VKKEKYDVIIVGAGPIGSYTAYLLAKEGLNVGIFEKNSDIGKDVNCTGIVSNECLKIIGLPEEVILRPVDSIKAFSPSGNCLRYHSTSPLAYVINRSLFDQEINRRAGVEGATTYLNTKVEEISITDGTFKIKVKTEGKDREFISKTGVIATGFELNSFIKTFKKPKHFLYGIQTHGIMEGVSDIEVYFGQKIAPGSFGWVVPTNGNSAKIGLITKKNPAEFLKKFLQIPLVAHRLSTIDIKTRCSPIPLGRIPKSYAERLVIVGEAAGQVKTTTGGGIYFGLLCSEIAAKIIKKAFNTGNYSEKMFEEYEKTWRSKVEHEIKAGMMLRNLFSRLSDRHIDLLIDLAKRDGIVPLIKKSHFDWHKDIIFSLSRFLISKKLFGNQIKHSELNLII